MSKNISEAYIGVDLYNLRLTEDIACSLTTVAGTPDGTGPKLLMIFGETSDDD